jgi:CheY-like chemotaxis protein
MKTLTVWIIEDDDMERAHAVKIVEEVGQSSRESTLDIWKSSSLEWGTSKWPPVSKNGGAQISPSRLPDVVILDLFEDGLKGDSFYHKLRKEETSNKSRRAFVVVWSRYSGVTIAEKFIEDTMNQDGNFIPLDTKSQRLLRDRLLSLVGRVEEES